MTGRFVPWCKIVGSLTVPRRRRNGVAFRTPDMGHFILTRGAISRVPASIVEHCDRQHRRNLPSVTGAFRYRRTETSFLCLVICCPSNRCDAIQKMNRAASERKCALRPPNLMPGGTQRANDHRHNDHQSSCQPYRASPAKDATRGTCCPRSTTPAPAHPARLARPITPVPPPTRISPSAGSLP